MTDTTAETTDPHRWLAAKSRWSPFEILFWLAALLPFFLLPGYLTLASQIAIGALFAISVDLVLGYAGIVTLGHAMFFGLGAYASGLLSKAGWGEPLTGLAFAGAIAGLAGFIVSFMIVRVKHLALLMITLGLGLLTYELANAMAWLTGGTDGLQGVDIWPLFGTFNFDLWGYTAYAYALAALFLGFVASRRIVNSAFGLALRGVRENVRRMPAIGSDYHWHLQKIYTISAVLAGVAGALLTQTTETVSLDTLSFQRSADVVVMLILGGTGRLYGGILGAIIFMVARDQLSGINPQYWYFWIGILLMVVVLTMPSGILGGLQRLLGGGGETLMAAEIVLATQGLKKAFGSLNVAKDISLELPRGARHALIGPNGAGKTTLINLITGELSPDSGRILLAGVDVTHAPVAARVRSGLTRTFQINTLFPDLTPVEAVTLAIAERERAAGQFWRGLGSHREAIDEGFAILSQLRLAEVATRATRTLPYGQQRLLEIALALATRPKVLLLDEPAAGVPKDESAVLFSVIAALPADISVLFIEHDMDIVFSFASRIIVLVAGGVLIEAEPEVVRKDARVREVYLGQAHV